MPNPETSTEQTEAYLRLLSQHERWLSGYVFSLVPHAADGEDILQEVKLTMWRHFSKFEAGSNFKAWARTIATHAVLNYRRSVKKRTHPELDDAFIEAVAAETAQQSDHLEDRGEALRHCLAKLPENQRRVISWRYFDDFDVEKIANMAGRSSEAVYKMLSRIRTVLNDCIERRLADA